MPAQKKTKPHLDYDDLLAFERGYAAALVDYFSNTDTGPSLDGLGVQHLSSDTLSMIARDCRKFVGAMLRFNPCWDEQIGFDEFELGCSFFLERQEVGVGFADLGLEDDLRDRMIDVASPFKPIEVEVCKCGSIHIVGSSPATLSAPSL